MKEDVQKLRRRLPKTEEDEGRHPKRNKEIKEDIRRRKKREIKEDVRKGRRR